MNSLELSKILIPKANTTAKYKDIPKVSPRNAIREDKIISKVNNNISLCTVTSSLFNILNIPFISISTDMVIYSVKTVLYVIVKLIPINSPTINPRIEKNIYSPSSEIGIATFISKSSLYFGINIYSLSKVVTSIP